MGQIPKDPQQLAQDILAGRVTIQQLQAEQARRRALQAAQREALRSSASHAPVAASRQPASPRQVVAPSTLPARAAIRPQRQVSPAGSSGRAAPAAKASSVRNQTASSAAAGAAASPPAAASPTTPAEKKTSRTPSPVPPARRTPAQTLRTVIHNPHTLRSIFVLSELLDKPLSLRPDPLDRF